MASLPESAGQPGARVDLVIVGAGILGLYQLYLALAAGYSVRLLEQGDGVGGTWYWNRYPGCRFDSESYTYGYLFSEELWQEWDWSEEFAAQPETEAYLNYVADKFGLRPHIRFAARVTAAAWDAASASWTTRTADGLEIRSRFLISATGVLSVPQYPDVPGREAFAGQAYHPGRWPKEPVTFAGQRVAVVGTGSSGVQIAPAIAADAESLTVYQRTPSWCTPLNNHPISADQRAYLKASFEPIRDQLNASIAGFLHQVRDRATFEDTQPERRAFYEAMWNSPGFAKLGSNYRDLMTSPAANAEWCAFLEGKIRAIVTDPATADRLVPVDHLYGGLRPPFVTGYYEMFNRPNVSLVSLRETPIAAVTRTGIQTADRHREFDIIIWATGFDFGTGAMLRMGIAGTGGRTLNESWADGPSTFGGLMCHGFPNFFFPGGPHGAAGNNPRYGGEQVDFIQDLISYARDHGYRRIEVPAEPQEAWMTMIDKFRARSSFQDRGQYYGGNTPGKPRRLLLNPGGRPQLAQALADVIASDYKGFLQ